MKSYEICTCRLNFLQDYSKSTAVDINDDRPNKPSFDINSCTVGYVNTVRCINRAITTHKIYVITRVHNYSLDGTKCSKKYVL